MIRYLLLLVAAGFLLYSAGTCLTQVQPGERAVVRQFGRILDHKPGPGLYVGWPWGIEQVTIVQVSRARTINIGFENQQDTDDEVVPPGQLLTGDHNLVNVKAVIDYKVREAEVEKFVLQTNNIDALVARASEALLAEWIAGRKVDEVLTRGMKELPGFLLARLQERLLDYDLGLEIERASITELFPPKEVKAAFDRVSQAETNIGTRLNQATQEARDRESQATAEKNRIRDMASAYATAERIKANDDAKNFHRRLTQYLALSRDNPDYINVLWRDEMTRLFARMKEEGRIEPLDHYLTSDGISITQFPLSPKKK